MSTVYNLSEDNWTWANKHSLSPNFFHVRNVKEVSIGIPEDI